MPVIKIVVTQLCYSSLGDPELTIKKMMKLVVAYFLGILAYIIFVKKAGGRKLSTASYVPLCWMIYILSRGLRYWLQMNSNVGRMETEMEGSSIDAAFLLLLIMMGIRI